MVDDRAGRDGRRPEIYTLDDVYPQADLVTYPSSIEGFGNAFLEAIYHRRPIVVNHYSIYEIDIKPKGFRVVEFDDYISRATIEEARRLLEHPDIGAVWAETNYALARRHFSFGVLERRLAAVLAECFGERRDPGAGRPAPPIGRAGPLRGAPGGRRRGARARPPRGPDGGRRPRGPGRRRPRPVAGPRVRFVGCPADPRHAVVARLQRGLDEGGFPSTSSRPSRTIASQL